MKIKIQRLICLLIPALAALAAVLLLGAWLTQDPTPALRKRVPGMDGKERVLFTRVGSEEKVEIGSYFARFDELAAVAPGSWPRFRGARFDNISTDPAPLLSSFGDAGPTVLWAVDLGEGHAAPAVHRGRVYLLDYDEEKKADVLRCFSLADGSELWRRGYKVRVKRNHGMSRTIPAVTDRFVVTIGPKAHVMCVEATTGDFLWGLDLAVEYGASDPGWYTGQCPLIDDGLAVLAPGSRAFMVAVNCGTGVVEWETPNPGEWQMSHSSVIPMTLCGRRQYVYAAIGGTAGVAADGPDRGSILWQTTAWDPSVLAPSALAIGGDRVLLTAGYGAGGMVLQISQDSGVWGAEVVERWTPKDGLACEQQTPILYDGHLFGILPKDAGALRRQFVCALVDDPSHILWSSGKEHRFGLGPFLLADGKFFVLDDDGVLTVLRASTSGYIQLARAEVLAGQDSWGPIALAGGRMLVRDSKRMVCLDMRMSANAGRTARMME